MAGGESHLLKNGVSGRRTAVAVRNRVSPGAILLVGLGQGQTARGPVAEAALKSRSQSSAADDRAVGSRNSRGAQTVFAAEAGKGLLVGGLGHVAGQHGQVKIA